jgi:hypothetical protein
VRTTARVIYENASDRRFEVGVEFLRLDPADRELLQASLDSGSSGRTT